jgi:putative tricarboxylic transport membrane protein
MSSDATDPLPATAEAEPVRTADVEVEASRLVRIIAAVVLVVLSATFLVGVFDIRSPKGLDPQGPRFFPLLVTVAWLLLSIGYLVEGLRSPRTAKAPAETGGIADRSWFEPVALCGLLVLYAFLVVPLGYMLSTALLFWGAARVLGSRQLVRDIVVAVVLAVVVYIAFTRFLDISLPEGVLGL